MPQTTYNRSMGPALAGQIADNNPHNVDTLLNKSGGSLAAGVAVAYGATTPSGGSAPIGAPPGYIAGNDGQAATNMAAMGDEIAGITVLTFATDPYNIAGTATYREGTTMDVLTEGQIFVAAEQVIAMGDSVNVRYAAVAGNTVLGAFTNTPDAGTRPVKGAKWKTPSILAGVANLQATAQNIALMYFSAIADFATH